VPAERGLTGCTGTAGVLSREDVFAPEVQVGEAGGHQYPPGEGDQSIDHRSPGDRRPEQSAPRLEVAGEQVGLQEIEEARPVGKRTTPHPVTFSHSPLDGSTEQGYYELNTVRKMTQCMNER
jgi:hypothetical protein